jgi:hypothetical protein
MQEELIQKIETVFNAQNGLKLIYKFQAWIHTGVITAVVRALRLKGT